MLDKFDFKIFCFFMCKLFKMLLVDGLKDVNDID